MAHRLEALQATRQASGLSIAQLAAKTNISEEWIRRGELIDNTSGNPSRKGAPFTVAESARIASALGVSLATLGKVDV